LLNEPVLLLGSGGKVDENGMTELGVSALPGKITVGFGPEINGVVLKKKGPP
jgi:hypothetical protein